MKKKKPIVLEELTPEELVKYEIAKELGLFERVMTNGWGSLSAKETGRIGGILAKRRKRHPVLYVDQVRVRCLYQSLSQSVPPLSQES